MLEEMWRFVNARFRAERWLLQTKQKPRRRRADGVWKRSLARGRLFGRLDGEHLAAFVVATGRAGHVSGDCAAAFRAGFEERCAPAGGALTKALAFLGLSALGVGHEGGVLGAI